MVSIPIHVRLLLRVFVLASVAVLFGSGNTAAQTGAGRAAPRIRSPQQLAADSARRVTASGLFPGGAEIAAGWTMGVAGDSYDPSGDRPENEKLDLAPYFHINLGFGDGSSALSTDVKFILANFGRLVNRVEIRDFSADTSGVAVRRAMIADFTLRTRLWTPWRNAGFALNLINTGFILDAQGESESEEALDAASYLLAGVTLVGGDSNFHAAADLLFGASEILTGDEAFDFSGNSHPSFRVRPRLWVRFPRGLGRDRSLDFGFWGDLGVKREEADAVTAFVSTRLFPGP